MIEILTAAVGSVAARLRAAPVERKAHGHALVAIEALRPPQWSGRDYAAFAREGFMQNAVVYRAVRMIAEGAAAVPLVCYDGDRELDGHAVAALLAAPNSAQGRADFVETGLGHLLVGGNLFINAVAVGGVIRELHALRPDRVRVLEGTSGWPGGYEYAADGASIRLAGEAVPGVGRVLHVRQFHPLGDLEGLSPVAAAAFAIDIHNAASRWNKALLDNAARPSGALVYSGGGTLAPEQFERLKGELADSFQGAGNAGRPLLLEGGLDWKAMGLTPHDMDFIDAKNAAAREIALAFGVPPMLLGIPGDNTYANYQEANRTLWRQTILPALTRLCDALAAWLQPAFDVARLRIVPDLDRVDALAAEREALWARLERSTFLTIDEKRQALGYAPIVGGDRL